MDGFSAFMIAVAVVMIGSGIMGPTTNFLNRRIAGPRPLLFSLIRASGKNVRRY